MNKNDIRIVKELFDENYRDIGIYRWMVRNIKWTRVIFIGSWVMCVIGAVTGINALIYAFFLLFFGLGLFGAIDHVIIGKSMKRVMKAVEKAGIKTSWKEVCDIVGIK
jgi:hypothetical protein